MFDTLESYEHHYHTLHRNVCSFCRRAFPSVHLLDTHILEWHDSLFQILSERQDMVGEASASPGPECSHLVGGGACSWAVCLLGTSAVGVRGEGRGHH